jgi:hypothetical protein
MLKPIFALGSALAAVPLLASPYAQRPLPGVSDRETVIPYRDIQQSVRGHGDVFFVRDRNNQWYRLQFNPGCAGLTTDADALIFDHHGASQQIDRFTTVDIPREARSCAIESIRESLAPPQVNSRSPVTLD